MILEGHQFPIVCSKCGARLEKTRDWLRSNDELVCGCGTSMHLETGDVVRAIDQLEEALERVQRPPPETGG